MLTIACVCLLSVSAYQCSSLFNWDKGRSCTG